MLTCSAPSVIASDEDEQLDETCVACLRILLLESFPPGSQLMGCNHLDDLCTQCWQEWLGSEIAETKTSKDTLSCPNCPRALDYEAVTGLATPEVFENYLTATLHAACLRTRIFRYCFYPSCNSGQIHEGDKIFTCESCRRKSCVDCHAEWHAGESCEVFQKTPRPALLEWEQLKEQDLHRREQSAPGEVIEAGGSGESIAGIMMRVAVEQMAAAEIVEEISKPCPGCQRPIQKEG